MGWVAIETTIEQLEGEVWVDPSKAVTRVEEILESGEEHRPTDRVRLLGYLSAAHRRRGELSECEDALSRADRIGRASRIALSELEVHRLALRICCKEWGEAARTAEKALEILPEAPKGDRRSGWSLRMERGRRRLEATALVHRGHVRLVGEKNPERGAADAVAALGVEPPSRQRVAASSLLARAFMRWGTMSDVLEGAKVIEASLEKSRLDRTAYAELRMCRAIVTARFGSTARAERMITDSIKDFRREGAGQNYVGAMEVLLWLIGERDGKPGRAKVVVRRLRGGVPRFAGGYLLGEGPDDVWSSPFSGTFL